MTVAGEGLPLVVVHGFSAEGFLYAQSLSRLVRMGFRVVAIDTAGHGATQGLPLTGHDINDYAELLGRAIDELGIERFLLAGHSMGGQLVARLAAQVARAHTRCDLHRCNRRGHLGPNGLPVQDQSAVAGCCGTLLLFDSVSIAPAFSDPRQAMKLMRLVTPTLFGHFTQPWRLLGPVRSILRTRSSRYALDELHRHKVPVVAIHGSFDLPVPHRTAVDTVRRTEGTLVTVQRGGHSWILRDPESLPAIMSEMLAGPLGEGIRDGLRSAGVRRKNPTLADIERVCYEPGAKVFELAPTDTTRKVVGRHRRPKYSWTIEHPRLEKLD